MTAEFIVHVPRVCLVMPMLCANDPVSNPDIVAEWCNIIGLLCSSSASRDLSSTRIACKVIIISSVTYVAI